MEPNKNSKAKAWALGSALAGGGLIIGIVTAGTLTANAATSDTMTGAAGSYSAPQGAPSGDPMRSKSSVRPDEQLLTGDTATKVTEAALAKYPGATVIRVETDSDGVYEAHLVKADGTPVTVEVDKSFAVTGDEAMGTPPNGAPQGAPTGAPSAGTATPGTAYSAGA